MADERIILELDLDTGKVYSKFKGVESVAETSGKRAGKNFSDGFKDSISSLAVKATQIGAVIGAAIGGVSFKRAIEESSRLENALIGVNSVAKAFNIGTDAIGTAVKDLASDGLIPLQDVTDSLKNLIVNFNGDLEKSVEVFNALKNAAAFNRQGALSLGEAIKGASEGLKNDLSIKVDNAGVTKNLSVLQAEYAKSIGVGVRSLTTAQKAQAEYVGILKESAIFQGDYNKLIKTFSGSVSGLQTSFRFLFSEIGNVVTRSPLVLSAITSITGSVNSLTKQVRLSGTDMFLGIVEGAIEVARAINNFIVAPVELVYNVFRVALNGVNTFVAGAVAGFGVLADGAAQLIEKFGGSGEFTQGLRDFAAASFETFQENEKALSDSIDRTFEGTVYGNTSEFISRVQANVDAANAITQNMGAPEADVDPGPKIDEASDKVSNLGAVFAKIPSMFSQGAVKITESMTNIEKAAAHLSNTALKGIGNASAGAFAAFGKALASGENALDAFVKSFLASLGQMMIQQGAAFILQGLGFSVIPGLQASGGTLIATGAALATLGGALTALGGGGGAPAAGGVAAGGGGPVGIGADETLTEPTEEREPEQRVIVNIEGSIYDSEETGSRIVNLINENFERSGSVVTGARFA